MDSITVGTGSTFTVRCACTVAVRRVHIMQGATLGNTPTHGHAEFRWRITESIDFELESVLRSALWYQALYIEYQHAGGLVVPRGSVVAHGDLTVDAVNVTLGEVDWQADDDMNLVADSFTCTGIGEEQGIVSQPIITMRSPDLIKP